MTYHNLTTVSCSNVTSVNDVTPLFLAIKIVCIYSIEMAVLICYHSIEWHICFISPTHVIATPWRRRRRWYKSHNLLISRQPIHNTYPKTISNFFFVLAVGVMFDVSFILCFLFVQINTFSTVTMAVCSKRFDVAINVRMWVKVLCNKNLYEVLV